MTLNPPLTSLPAAVAELWHRIRQMIRIIVIAPKCEWKMKVFEAAMRAEGGISYTGKDKVQSMRFLVYLQVQG